jgi:hypothetical protein
MPTALLIAAVAIAASFATATPAPAQVSFADAAAIPDPHLTPGEVVSTERAAACAQGHTRRPNTVEAAHRVLELYGVPFSQRHNYEVDHLVPRCLGGADAMANLWPQPLEEAVRKDEKEREICRAVCNLRIMSIEEGQRYFVEGRWR